MGAGVSLESMTAQRIHKKRLLQALAVVLAKDDDFRHDEDPLEGLDYDRWSKARDELVVEFERRGK
jgi:hypothetical protein